MQILLITNAFAQITNGPAKFAHYLLDVAALLPGHEVRVLTEDIESPEAETAVAMGVAYHMSLRIPTYAKPLGQWLRMGQYYRQALALRASYPWQVLVYINAFQGAVALKQGQVPVLGMINDDNNARATLAGALRGPRGLKQWLFRRIEQKVARQLPFVITNSQYLTHLLAREYALPSARLRVLYKSVDASSLPYQPERAWPGQSEAWHILFVKTDYTRGGLADLAEALKLLPDENFVLDVAGPPAVYQDSIRALFGGAPHVQLRLLGPQPQAVIRQKLYQAHIFCVPARSEALGVANMEAALAGTPIVSTTAGGIPEVLDNGKAAFLAIPNHPASLADALQRCMREEGDRAARQAHARQFVENTFAKERMLKEFMALAQEAEQFFVAR